MGIRLICSDLDGTLLQYGKKELEGEIFDQIRALHDLSSRRRAKQDPLVMKCPDLVKDLAFQFFFSIL